MIWLQLSNVTLLDKSIKTGDRKTMSRKHTVN